MTAPSGGSEPGGAEAGTAAMANLPAQPQTRRRFLERRSYRLARMQDAARLMPVLGLFLFFGPIAILAGDGSLPEGGTLSGTSGWLVYFLVVWAALIVLTAVLSRAMLRHGPELPKARLGRRPRAGGESAPDGTSDPDAAPQAGLDPGR